MKERCGWSLERVTVDGCSIDGACIIVGCVTEVTASTTGLNITQNLLTQSSGSAVVKAHALPTQTGLFGRSVCFCRALNEDEWSCRWKRFRCKASSVSF